MISRWCAGPVEVWQMCPDVTVDQWVPVEVSPHALCAHQRRQGHDGEAHRDCCWSPEETESRDCTCPCHTEAEAK